jgi:hypothetical protein
VQRGVKTEHENLGHPAAEIARIGHIPPRSSPENTAAGTKAELMKAVCW